MITNSHRITKRDKTLCTSWWKHKPFLLSTLTKKKKKKLIPAPKSHKSFSLQEIQETEHVKWHQRHAISKMGNFSGQTTLFLQKMLRRGKKKRWRGSSKIKNDLITCQTTIKYGAYMDPTSSKLNVFKKQSKNMKSTYLILRICYNFLWYGNGIMLIL